MGGAMDLVAGSPRVIVTMEHVARGKDPAAKPDHKIVGECSLPLTGRACVDMIITDLAVFQVKRGEGLTLTERAHDVTVDDIKAATGCAFAIAPDVKVIGAA
jgi:3-oxoacid CoA-transferase